MSREVENLINENAQLMATKNALNVVKDDLIQKVDQLTTHQTLLKWVLLIALIKFHSQCLALSFFKEKTANIDFYREELKANEKAKSDLEEKVKDFEKQVISLKQELSNVAGGVNNESNAGRKTEEEVSLN